MGYITGNNCLLQEYTEFWTHLKKNLVYTNSQTLLVEKKMLKKVKSYVIYMKRKENDKLLFKNCKIESGLTDIYENVPRPQWVHTCVRPGFAGFAGFVGSRM